MMRLAIAIMLIPFLSNAQVNFPLDIEGAVQVCNTDTIKIVELHGIGIDEVKSSNCLEKDIEKNSAWFYFQVMEEIDLEFTIIPKRRSDDIDFYFFKRNSDTELEEMRCVASGANKGNVFMDYLPCLGITGMRLNQEDEFEAKGCFGIDDNFVSSIRAVPGEVYYLLVNNFSNSNGFNLVFQENIQFFTPTVNVETLPKYVDIGYFNEKLYASPHLDNGYNLLNISALDSNESVLSNWQVESERLYSIPEGTYHFKIVLSNLLDCRSEYILTLNEIARKTFTNKDNGVFINPPYPNPVQAGEKQYIDVYTTNPTHFEYDVIDLNGRILDISSTVQFEGYYRIEFTSRVSSTSPHILRLRWKSDNEGEWERKEFPLIGM